MKSYDLGDLHEPTLVILVFYAN